MDTITQPLASIGIDIGKEVFHVVGLGTDGKIAFRRKIKRLALVETFRRLPPSVVGMEACLSAHPCLVKSIRYAAAHAGGVFTGPYRGIVQSGCRNRRRRQNCGHCATVRS